MRLRREDAEAGRDQRRMQPLLRRQQRRPRLQRAKLRRRGIDQPVGRHHPGRGRQAEAPGGQLIDRLPLDRHRAAGIGAGADDLFGQRQVDPADPAAAARVVDLRRGRFRLAGKRRAHRLRPARERCGSYLRMPSSSGHSAGGSALASALCTATWTIFGREAVGVDAGDQHPRRVGLAHAKQQPGALGDPVDRIDVDAARRPWRAARRAARYAPSARRAACPSAASGVDRNAPLAVAPGVGAKPELRGIELSDGPRIAPRPAGIFDRRRRRRQAERAMTSSTALSSAPRRRRGCVAAAG